MELADTRDLKSRGSNTVPVRVRPRAPICSISLAGKASACQVEDRGFEPRMLLGHIGLPSRGVSVFTKNLNINKKGVD